MLVRAIGALALVTLSASALAIENPYSNHTEIKRGGCKGKPKPDSASFTSHQALFAEGNGNVEVEVVTVMKTVTLGGNGNGNAQNTQRPRPAQQTTAEPAPESPKPSPTPKPKEAPASNNDDSSASVSGSNVSADERQAWLDAHNAARAQYGAPPVTWDVDAETQAAANADLHKDTCQLEHTPDGVRKYGENLAMGTNLTPQGAVDMYMSEAKDYNYNTAAFSMGTGHFTQVVWKGTTGIGCATRKCSGGAMYTACGYNPPGNMAGAFTDNVLPKGS